MTSPSGGRCIGGQALGCVCLCSMHLEAQKKVEKIPSTSTANQETVGSFSTTCVLVTL